MLCACTEPSLKEILDDPIIQAIMRRDAVQEHELLMLIETVRRAALEPAEQPDP